MPNKISLFHELTDLLEKIKSKARLNEDKFIESIESKTYDKVLEIGERNMFDVNNLASKEFEVYATTNPKEVSFKFSLKYNLENKVSENRTNVIAESKGELLLNIDNYQIRNFRNLGECVCWVDNNGVLKEANNFYVIGDIVLGHKTIEHQVSYKLG